MRYAIISDIHSNLQAFQAALDEIKKESVDTIICLGDIVGYNANPIECMALLENTPNIKYILGGNHDIGASDYSKMSYTEMREWSQDAIDGLTYSNSLLKDSHRQKLLSLPDEMLISDSKRPFLITHYSPCGRNFEWGYILDKYTAIWSVQNMEKRKADLCFFGHSHLPTVVFAPKSNIRNITLDMGTHFIDNTYFLKSDYIYLFNPGAIGQPRSRGKTTFIIYDDNQNTVSFKEFSYDIKEAQESIMTAKYSNSTANIRLAKRLNVVSED